MFTLPHYTDNLYKKTLLSPVAFLIVYNCLHVFVLFHIMCSVSLIPVLIH